MAPQSRRDDKRALGGPDATIGRPKAILESKIWAAGSRDEMICFAP